LGLCNVGVHVYWSGFDLQEVSPAIEKVNDIDLIHFHLFWMTLAGILQYPLSVMLRSSGNVR